MKKYSKSLFAKAGGTLFATGALVFAFLAVPDIFAQDSGQAELSAPGKDLRAPQNTVDESFSETATWSRLEEPERQSSAPGHAAPKTPARAHAQPQPRVEDSRNVAPGYNGYMGTYVDPANGDIVTSVIAPTNPNSQQQYQNYPIIIEPQVGSWGNSNWNNGWNNPNWNNGWQGPGQQVPGYPWPPAQPGFQPSGQVPGYPWPPSPEGYGPPPPPPGGWANQGSYPPPGPVNNPPGPGPAAGQNPNPGPAGNPGAMPPPGNRPPQPGQNPPGVPPNGGIMPPTPPASPGMSVPDTPLQPAFPNNGNPGGLMPPNPGAQMPGNAPGYFPANPARPGGFGAAPGPVPGRGPQSGIPRSGIRRPHSELMPPRNPGRPGSMPLVAPNFPPHVEHKPFVDLYRPPMAGMQRKSAPTLAGRHEEAAPYYVPGSAQSWQPSNWQHGK